MKLYNSIGPNPHIVRMFMAEKGIEMEKVEIDIMAADNRAEGYWGLIQRGSCRR